MTNLEPQEVRRLAIDLLTAPTARDQQRRVGASNLSNGCDFCLASNLMGDMRETSATGRAWGGRVLGTALHHVFERRMNAALSGAGDALGEIGRRFPNARVEQHMVIGTLGSYGDIGSTPDLEIGADIFDYKNKTRKKSLLLRDYLKSQGIGRQDVEPYGRTHKDIKLSEKDYAAEMEKQAYMVNGYYAQINLYIRGARLNGRPVTRGTLIFVNRDGTMWFDNPAQADYENETRVQDVWVLPFQYNEAYAEAVWARALRVWESLESGATPNDFPSHPMCFPCSLDRTSTSAAVAA